MRESIVGAMSMEPDPTQTERPVVETSSQPIAPGTNGFAIASLILGIVGFTTFPLIPSILAIVFGYKGRNEIDRSGGVQQGRGLAVAGIVLGWIAVVLAILLIALVAVLWIINLGAAEVVEIPLKGRS